jgi:predicted alpha/beta hydrolase
MTRRSIRRGDVYFADLGNVDFDMPAAVACHRTRIIFHIRFIIGHHFDQTARGLIHPYFAVHRCDAGHAGEHSGGIISGLSGDAGESLGVA